MTGRKKRASRAVSSANSGRGLLGAACAGLGIALLPSVLVASALDDGRLRRVLPAFGQRRGGLHAVYPSRLQRSLAAVALVEFFADRLGYIDAR